MPTIEKDWTTAAGLRAVILMTSMGHRCGYVGVPPGHPLHGIEYSEPCDALKPLDLNAPIGKRGVIPFLCYDPNSAPSPSDAFDVHGSLTYSDNDSEYPVKDSGLWWFGFDCAHYNDMTSFNPRGVLRTLEYCVAECESLALQLHELQG